MTPRRSAVAPVLLVLAVLTAGVGLCLGSAFLSPETVWAALWGNATPQESFVVLTLRLPRVGGAIAAGALLAWSGLILQGLFRNPLVSPDLLGIETGASAAVVLGVVVGWSSTLTGWLAFGGAGLAAVAIGLLGGLTKAGGPRLVLVGLGVQALLAAFVSLLLIQGNVYQAAKAYQWMVGSLYSTTPEEATFLGTAVVALGALGLAFIPSLRLLQVGDIGARGLGARTRLWTLGWGLLACALAASAVSVVGPLGFVALAVPHAARALSGPVGPASFVTTGLLGGVTLLSVDLVGQHLIPGGLPAGVLAAGLGGPYFLYLLRRRGPVL